MKILKNIKNLFKEDEESKLYSRIFLFLIFCAFSIAFIFRILPYGEQLEIKDYFNFAGAFGGAIIGGFISLIILKVSLKEQKDQFEKQKEIEDTRREEDRKQFERQLKEERNRFEKEYNIKLINDKIDQYKNLYLTCQNMISSVMNISNKLKIHEYRSVNEENISNIQESIGIFLTSFTDLTADFVFYSEILNETNYEYENISTMFNRIGDYIRTSNNNIELNDKITSEAKEIDKYLKYLISKCKDLSSKK